MRRVAVTSDGAVHADGDIAARDVKESGDLLVRESLVKTQLNDLAVGSWKQIDHFPRQNKEFSLLSESFRVQAWGSLALEWILAAADPFSTVILGRKIFSPCPTFGGSLVSLLQPLRCPSCLFVDNSFQAGTGFQRMAHSSDLPVAPAQRLLDSSSWVIPPTVRIMPSSSARLWLKPLLPSP